MERLALSLAKVFVILVCVCPPRNASHHLQLLPQLPPVLHQSLLLLLPLPLLLNLFLVFSPSPLKLFLKDKHLRLFPNKNDPSM